MYRHSRVVKVFRKQNVKNIKRIALKDAKSLIAATLEKLKKEQDYLGKDCLKLTQALFFGCTGPYGGSEHMFKTINDSYKFGDLLAELGFQDIAVTIYKEINNPSTILNEVIKRIWKLTTYLCYCFTVHSEKLSMYLGDAGAVEQLTKGIHFICLSRFKSKLDHFCVCITSMGILYNIVKFTENRSFFQQAKTFQLIMKLNDAGFSCISNSFTRLLLPYIVDEKEYDMIAGKTDLIGQIIHLLRSSYKTVKSGKVTLVNQMTFHTFKPWEFIHCICKLAVNDSNKEKMIEKGALVVFAKVLSRNDVREVKHVTECLWTLSFDNNVRQTIKDAPQIISFLEKLKESDDIEIRKNVSGTLWMIDGKNDTKESQVLDIDGVRHVFISYHWADKDTVKMIYTRLKEKGEVDNSYNAFFRGATKQFTVFKIGKLWKLNEIKIVDDLGYKLWINWDGTSGSKPQEMAEVVENASVVLMCMSAKYKESPNCRLEAEYIYKKCIEYIPLLVQNTYDPDGWLRFFLGGQLYFDFSGKDSFYDKIQGLDNELKRVLRKEKMQEKKSLDADQDEIQKSKLCEIL